MDLLAAGNGERTSNCSGLSYVLLYLQATLLMFYSYNWSGYLIQIGFVVAVFVLYFKELTGVARKVLSRVKSR